MWRNSTGFSHFGYNFTYKLPLFQNGRGSTTPDSGDAVYAVLTVMQSFIKCCVGSDLVNVSGEEASFE